jgi:hypothetical protein
MASPNSRVDETLLARIVERLKTISANDLQALAEEIALIKFPQRFSSATLLRQGRNVESQTTKGWPDAFVQTGPNEVDAIEATREGQSWTRHLDDDLKKTQDAAHYELSGYFFVAGYPTHEPTASEITEWVNKFVSAGVTISRVSLLVGKHLAFELCGPLYAQVRHRVLGLQVSPSAFQLLMPGFLGDNRLGTFQPSPEDFANNRVSPPALLSTVLHRLNKDGCALLRGHGASGKTTLAQLLAQHPQITPLPTYYLDLGATRTDEILGAALNDMAAFGGRRVTFVVDNIHLDEQLAKSILEHWRRTGSAAGTTLLLQGRELSNAFGTPLGDLKPDVLRAREPEMLSIVGRMFDRLGKPRPTFSQEDVKRWTRVFGGDPADPATTVDLIAFGAAVEQRMPQLARGDGRLSEQDAVEAVGTRYLQPLRDTAEWDNVLTLAALAEYEIPLTPESLPTKIDTFPISSQRLGIVLTQKTAGKEPYQTYRLAHPALGRLLLAAANRSHLIQTDRVRIATDNPSIGIRILARSTDPDESSNVSEAIKLSISTPNWIKRCANLYEVTAVIRTALRRGLCTSSHIDKGLSADPDFYRILRRTRSLESINSLVSWAKQFELNAILELVSTLAKDSEADLVRTLYVSRLDDIAALIRMHPNGASILERVDNVAWNRARGTQPVEPATQTLSALRLFARLGRHDLCTVPGNLFFDQFQTSLWHQCNISHLSQLFRLARPKEIPGKALVETLVTSGWLATAMETTSLGHLCGGLMSLGNYMDPTIRNMLVGPPLEARVRREASSNFGANKKLDIRKIGLVGAYANLAGQAPTGLTFKWRDDGHLRQLLDRVAPRHRPDVLGMWELQFWLGLKALVESGHDAITVPTDHGNAFLRRLEAASPPTSQAQTTKEALLGWLRKCAAQNWVLSP